MMFHSTDTVCGITGVTPETLRNWRRCGLITAPQQPDGYSEGQIIRIRTVMALTAAGDTLREIRAYLLNPGILKRSGWECRKEELSDLLISASDDTLYKYIRQTGHDYVCDDFINDFLRPTGLWLRSDLSAGAADRLARFHTTVVLHAGRVMSAATRRKSVPVFLEAISVNDPTEIWMEAIRLTGQGCRVELSAAVTEIPATPELRYEHHLMWCGAGINLLMRWNFRHRLGDGMPVMLCGPDQALRTAT